MSRLCRSLAPYLAGAAVAAALAAVALRLWRADLNVPLQIGGDNWTILAWARGIQEHGWYLSNPDLGAPHGMDMRDFPLADPWHCLWLKGLLCLGCSPALAVNLYYLAGFPLAAVSALWVLRRWGVSPGPAFVAAQLFALLPAHFIPGQEHLFLASYYLLPPLIGLILCVWRHGGLPPTANLQSPIVNRQSSISSSSNLFNPTIPQSLHPLAPANGPRTLPRLAAASLCLIAGTAGVYYAFFTCFFLLVAGLACALRQRRPRPLLSAGVFIALICAGVTATMIPTLVYQRRHLDNPFVGQRHAYESVRYGLQLRSLLTPVPGHYLPPLADARRRADLATQPYTNEHGTAALGLAGSLGFLYLLGRLLVPRGRPDSPPLDDGLSLLNLGGLLLALMGGGGALFALVVSPSLRCQLRLCVFLGFFALFALALLLSRLERRLNRPAARRLFAAALAALLVLGSLDQTGRAIVPDHAANARRWRHDADFIAAVEARLPPGGAVYCLPNLDFPESGGLGRMGCCYELFRGYLHSRRLRWSYGAMRGRYPAAWQQRLDRLSPEELLDTLALAGFDGLLVDRAGFLAEQEEPLACLLGSEALVSPDGRLAFHGLAGHREQLRRSLPPAELAARRQEALNPVLATWHGEASGEEGKERVRRLGGRACVVLHNPGAERRATLTLEFARSADRGRSPRLRLEGDGWSAAFKVPPEGFRFEREVILRPGENRVWIHAAGPAVDRPHLPRRAVVELRTFAVHESNNGGPPDGGPPALCPPKGVTSSSR